LFVAVFGLVVSNHEPTKKAVFRVKASPDQIVELTPAEVAVIKSLVSAVNEKIEGARQDAGTAHEYCEAGTHSERIPDERHGKLITASRDPATKDSPSPTSIDPATP
jgi:hypothetical protein